MCDSPSYIIWQETVLRLYFRWIFCCREDKEKVNIVDHEDDDTVAFNLKDTWYFNQKESGNLTGDEIITIPNVLLLVRTQVLRCGDPVLGHSLGDVLWINLTAT